MENRNHMPKLLPMEDISNEDFWGYEAVRISGQVNMNSPAARELMGISRDQHYTILIKYAELKARYARETE